MKCHRGKVTLFFLIIIIGFVIYLKVSRNDKRYQDIIQAYDILIETFIDEKEGFIFPEDFAGAIKKEEYLLIRVTKIDNRKKLLERYRSYIGMNIPIKFETNSRSLNELIRFGEIASRDIPLEITGRELVIIEGRENRYNIYVDIVNEQEIRKIRELSSYLVFVLEIPFSISVEIEGEMVAVAGSSAVSKIKL